MAKVSEKMLAGLTKVWGFLKPFLTIFLTSAGLALAKAATQAVTTVAETAGDADADDKRKQAFALIVENLKAQGIELSASVINAALEAAVQKLKSK